MESRSNMNAKPQLFLSPLPLLTDYVTIQGEITTSGPHLLNCACCRALLRKTKNILCSPALNDKRRVYIVIHKNDVKRKEFSESVTACNLKLVKVMQLTNAVLQFCLDFTVHTYLHPQWTRIDNKYFQGSSCLFQNRWMGCIRAQLNVQADSLMIALRGSQVKLVVAKLSTFHIRDETIQRFMKKEVRTIISSEMGDNTCYVLPSFKPALVHSISYDIDKNCPLKDKSDMMAYWLDYHGMLIPSDTEIFVTLSFNFPGAPTMTYPYYCIRKSFAAQKPGRAAEYIRDFVTEVNDVLKTKLPNLKLNFPINPVFYTDPGKSKNCLVEASNKDFEYKSNKTSFPEKVVNLNPISTIMPSKDSFNPRNHNSSTVNHKDSVPKIKPRFTPYQKPKITSGPSRKTQENSNNGDQTKVIPSFKPKSIPNVSMKSDSEKSAYNINVIRPVSYNSNHAKQNFNEVNNVQIEAVVASSPSSAIKEDNHPSISSCDGKHANSQIRVEHISKSSHSSKKRSQSGPMTPVRPRTPCSIPSSFNDDDFDDFELPQSLKFPSPKPRIPKTPESTPKPSCDTRIVSPMCKTPQSETKKKPKAPPKIFDEEHIKTMFRLGTLTKINNQSLTAFLKKRNVKGVSKFKKDQLVSETLKLLGADEPLREW